MKRFFYSLFAALICAGIVYGQGKPEIIYADASAFPVFGKAIDNTYSRYTRLPAELEKVSRGPLWHLGLNSAGLYVRFRSNSPSIYARWTSSDKYIMSHQAPTGTRGLDLYAIDNEGNWRFVQSGRPDVNNRTTTVTLVSNMKPAMREYMLYLSLYCGVDSLEIGVDKGFEIAGPAAARPASDRPIVMYGTSILQGGCASRPGMAHTNIISRRLDREVINLGFSGNALLDMEIAELMAKVEDPAVFVFDYVPNASSEMIAESGEKFFRIVRDAHPDVPVIFVEDPEFTHCYYDAYIRKEVASKNMEQRKLYEKLLKQGEKLIYYVSAKGMIGDDAEATVDGIHFTDLGMMRYADHITPVLKKALKKSLK